MNLAICKPIGMFLFVLAALVLFAGCDNVANGRAREVVTELATNSLVISKAESVSATTSALRSIEKGDIELAKITLEAHLRPGVAILKNLRTGNEGAHLAMVDEAIANAEQYIAEHGLEQSAVTHQTDQQGRTP
jgi:hypothetical protein